MADPELVAQILEVLSDPMNLPSSFWDYATQNWLKDAPVFPISQVFGFAAFTALPATPVATSETTASLTYTDLATVGPSLSGIPSGSYLVAYGATILNSFATEAGVVSVSVNGVADDDAIRAGVKGQNDVSVSRIAAVSLANANGNNTLNMQYRVSGGTGSFYNRWMLALKYANV